MLGLDAAETIVDQSGAAALTIDAVAKAIGISKGGRHVIGTAFQHRQN